MEKIICPLGETTCCYAAIVSGYCHDIGNPTTTGHGVLLRFIFNGPNYNFKNVEHILT
jgi:hypothetical protein